MLREPIGVPAWHNQHVPAFPGDGPASSANADVCSIALYSVTSLAGAALTKPPSGRRSIVERTTMKRLLELIRLAPGDGWPPLHVTPGTEAWGQPKQSPVPM